MDTGDRKVESMMDERAGKERAMVVTVVVVVVGGTLRLSLSLMMEEGQSHSTVERVE